MEDRLTVEEGIEYPRVEIRVALAGKTYKVVPDIDRELLRGRK